MKNIHIYTNVIEFYVYLLDIYIHSFPNVLSYSSIFTSLYEPINLSISYLYLYIHISDTLITPKEYKLNIYALIKTINARKTIRKE